MAYGDCKECKCPHNWHNYVTGLCYGCGKICQSEIVPETPPFELAQDMDPERLKAYGQSDPNGAKR